MPRVLRPTWSDWFSLPSSCMAAVVSSSFFLSSTTLACSFSISPSPFTHLKRRAGVMRVSTHLHFYSPHLCHTAFYCWSKFKFDESHCTRSLMCCGHCKHSLVCCMYCVWKHCMLYCRREGQEITAGHPLSKQKLDINRLEPASGRSDAPLCSSATFVPTDAFLPSRFFLSECVAVAHATAQNTLN